MLWRIMTKRGLHPFYPRPDIILCISPLCSSVPFLWCTVASSHSVSSCWCNSPGNGTSHPESMLCLPSLANPLFCFCSSFSLNLPSKSPWFPRNQSVRKSSAYDPLLIIFHISSGIQDGNFLIHCSESKSKLTPSSITRGHPSSRDPELPFPTKTLLSRQ